MKTFIATTGKGFGDSSLARAKLGSDGKWSVEFPLKGQDARCLAADPLNPGFLYAGTQGNGIFRSEDGGKTWQSAGLEGQIVKALAVSAHESGKIFAGTKPAYLFVSPDHGQSWQELDSFRHIRGRRLWFSPAEKPGQAYVMAITFSPTEPQTVLVGIEFGAVIRSIDGGETWSNHISESLRDCHDLTFNARDGDWVYEAGGTGGGASFSQDGGKTWQKKKSGLAKNYGVACAADPDRPEVWYVSVAPGPGKAYGQQAEAYLYRSNGGASWKPIGWDPHPMGQMPIALVTDPNHSGHLYAGLTNGDVLFSEDFGEEWMTLPFNLGGIYRSLIMT